MARPSSGVGKDQRDVAVQGPKRELSDDDGLRSNYGYQCVATLCSNRVVCDVRDM